ncbi:MAG: hypothetical protein ACREFX_01240, partial [Opitutaceae bacterium]
MSDSRENPAAEPARQRTLSVWQNWISLAGAIVGGGSLFAFLLLFAFDVMGGGRTNPYLGILCYV